MYVFVWLDDGTPVLGATFNYPSRLANAAAGNYYWVDIPDNQNLYVMYNDIDWVFSVNVQNLPSLYGNDPESWLDITITPGYRIPGPAGSWFNYDTSWPDSMPGGS